MTANPLPHPWQPKDTMPHDDTLVWVAYDDDDYKCIGRGTSSWYHSGQWFTDIIAWAPYVAGVPAPKHPAKLGWSPYKPTLPLGRGDCCIEHRDSDDRYAWGALVETTGLGYYGHMFAWAVVHALVHLGSQMTWRTPEPPLPWPWVRASQAERVDRRRVWMAGGHGGVSQVWEVTPDDPIFEPDYIICELEGRWADVAPPHPAHITRYGWNVEQDR
jgi:hypothetical protein